jgi:mRNA-degrading endonuclease toxin of MazEF toxin-antitoxin module
MPGWWLQYRLSLITGNNGITRNRAGYSRRLFIGIPLSTTKNRGAHHYAFVADDGQESVALLMQIRAFDTARLQNRKSTIRKEELVKITEKIKNLLP